MSAFYTEARIIITLDANNHNEARATMNKVVNEVHSILPIGVTINFPEDGDFPVYRVK